MAAIQFPNNPNTGDLFTASNGIRYTYDGEKWKTLGSSTAGSEGQFLETPNILTLDKIIPGDTNTGAVGPMAIDAGITLTIPVSSTFRTLSGKSGSVLPSAVDSGGVKLAGDATAQTITGTGGLKTDGLLDSGGGLNVTGGNVGIGTSSPTAKLDVEAGDLGSAAASTTTAATFRAGRQNFVLKNTRTATSTNWDSATFSMVAQIDTTNHQSIDFVNDSNFDEHIDIRTGNHVFNTRFSHNGNVGIGTSSPGAKVHIQRSVVANAPSRDNALYLENNANCEIMMVGNPANDCQVRFGTSNSSFKGAIEYQLDVDVLLAYVNGSERLRIDSTGNVGIGNIGPQQALHVTRSGGNNFAGIRSQNSNSGTGAAGIEFSSDATYAKAAIGLVRSHPNGAGSLVFYNASSTGAANWSTADERLRIDRSGNVGIGTSSPQYPLDVAGNMRFGSSNGYALLQYGLNSTPANNWHVGSEGDGTFRFYNGVLSQGSERMRITSNGNVGIGTSNPKVRLDINGDTTSLKNSFFASNLYYEGGWKYKTNGHGGFVKLADNGGGMAFGVSPENTSGVDAVADPTTAMFIKSTNAQVGIGTTNPQERLHVDTRIRLSNGSYSNFSVFTGSNGESFLDISPYTTAADKGAVVRLFRNTTAASSDFVIHQGDNTTGFNCKLSGSGDSFLNSATGNVGIGTSSPAHQLSIYGTGAVRNEIVCTDSNAAGAGIYLRTLNNGSTVSNATLHTNSSGSLLIYTGASSSASERLRIDSTGNVGIGTSSPSTKLAVNGTISGTLQNSDVRNATASSSAGAVGTYAFLKSGSNSSAGATKSGSTLRYSNANGTNSGTPAGSWRLMGFTQGSSNSRSTSVWLRYV